MPCYSSTISIPFLYSPFEKAFSTPNEEEEAAIVQECLVDAWWRLLRRSMCGVRASCDPRQEMLYWCVTLLFFGAQCVFCLKSASNFTFIFQNAIAQLCQHACPSPIEHPVGGSNRCHWTQCITWQSKHHSSVELNMHATRLWKVLCITTTVWTSMSSQIWLFVPPSPN